MMRPWLPIGPFRAATGRAPGLRDRALGHRAGRAPRAGGPACRPGRPNAGYWAAMPARPGAGCPRPWPSTGRRGTPRGSRPWRRCRPRSWPPSRPSAAAEAPTTPAGRAVAALDRGDTLEGEAPRPVRPNKPQRRRATPREEVLAWLALARARPTGGKPSTPPRRWPIRQRLQPGDRRGPRGPGRRAAAAPQDLLRARLRPARARHRRP